MVGSDGREDQANDDTQESQRRLTPDTGLCPMGAEAGTDGKHADPVMAAPSKQRRHTMKNDTPHTLDHFSARMRFPGGRVTKSFGAWLEECERHDSWHELPEEQRKPTLANVAAFLDDYADFEPVQ
jgi:hypothetical protein